MNAADEMATQLETNEHQAASVGSGSRDEFDKFDEQVRAAVKDFQRAGDHLKSVDDMQNHLSLIDRRLDHETSERRAIYYRLVATEREVKRQGSLKSVGYLVATCVGVVAGALAWQSYGGASKKIIATGSSPEAISSSARATQQSALGAPTAPVAVPPTAAAQQTVAQNLVVVRETLEQLAARQDQMEHDITKLQAVDMEILAQTPSSLAQPPATTTRNPTPIAPPLSRRP